MKRILLILLFFLLSLAVACRPQQGPSAGAIQPAEQDPAPLPAPTAEAQATAGQMGQGAEEMSEAVLAARPQHALSQAEGPGSLVPVDVQHVQVEVGVGSPIPVDAVVAGFWPGLCAQLAEVRQNVTGFEFDISLLADPGPLACPPDHVGLSFRMAIPLNVAELPGGTYSVTVNEVSATFDVPVTPTVPVDPQTGAPLETDPGSGPALALCPEVPRPALALFLPGEGYLISDPLSAATCRTTLDGDVPGLFQAAGDALYFTVVENDQFVVKRLAQSGEASLLSFTAVDRDDALLYHSFVVSADGQRIAWSAASTPAGQMWVAGMDGTEILAPLPELAGGGTDEQPRVLVPIRFSKDGNTLFFTRQLVEAGGIWSAYVGRYDNLYALRLDDEPSPALIFDCAGEQATLCIGDFQDLGGEVQTLAYVEEKALVVVDGAGEVLNRIEFDADYVGYPTFGPQGQLAVYSARGTTTITPDEGAIYLVDAPAAASAVAELLVSGPDIFLPKAWFDPGHLVIAHHGADDNWHPVVVGLDGLMVAPASAANAIFVDVLPAASHEGEG